MATVYGMSENDARLFQEMVRWFKRHGAQTPRTYVPQEDWLAPECYLVRTPAAGIPALSDVGTGTGTGTGTSTAQAADDLVEPGSATCQVFRVSASDLLVWAGFSITVWNANPFIIPGWLFIKVTRDKFGKWWAPTLPLRVSQCA